MYRKHKQSIEHLKFFFFFVTQSHAWHFNTVWSHSLTYEDPDSPAHSHEIGSGNQTNSMHWRWKRTMYNCWGSSLPQKNWARFARSPLKIFDAELQCGDSEQALIHFSVSPSSVKHQSHCGGCGNFGENAPRKLRKRGYTPQHRCAPLSRDYHQPHEK